MPFLSLHFWALHCNVYEHKLCSISLQQHVPPQFNIYYPHKYSLLEIRDTKQGRDAEVVKKNGAFLTPT